MVLRNFFKCNICLKQITQSGGLRFHMRVYTGEDPFKYDISLKQFSQFGYLNTHLKIYTNKTPLKCEIISELFTQSYRVNVLTVVKPFFLCWRFKSAFVNSHCRVTFQM